MSTENSAAASVSGEARALNVAVVDMLAGGSDPQKFIAAVNAAGAQG